MKDITVNNGPIFKHKYGQSKVVGFYVIDPRFNSKHRGRIEEYTSNSTGETETETIHCKDKNDLSNHHDRSAAYNSNCYYCWAGIGHTEQAHNNSIT